MLPTIYRGSTQHPAAAPIAAVEAAKWRRKRETSRNGNSSLSAMLACSASGRPSPPAQKWSPNPDLILRGQALLLGEPRLRLCFIDETFDNPLGAVRHRQLDSVGKVMQEDPAEYLSHGRAAVRVGYAFGFFVNP